MTQKIKFIDLFSGMGGFRKGFELACDELGYNSECVFTSEIKQSAQKVYSQNYRNETIFGDIRQIESFDIPDFDIMLAGFPCLVGNTLVLTKDGYKQLVDIKPGEMVLSHDNQYHEVLQFIDQGIKPVFQIEVDGCEPIYATDNHRFYVLKKNTFGEPEWLSVDDLITNGYENYYMGSFTAFDTTKQGYFDNEYHWLHILNITSCSNEAVYDIEVAVSHSFIANNCITHNCQAFSTAGKRLGFEDTRGTLFFEVARILKEKQPSGFILENVEGLVMHDKQNKGDKIGKTLQTILNILTDLGYHVSWKVLDSQYFGVAQSRKRIYIVGSKKEIISLENFPIKQVVLKDILETGLKTSNSATANKLLEQYELADLYGLKITDKRGGEKTIHSWELELKGKISDRQKELMSLIMTERRKKKWAKEMGVEWTDGMPLTLEQIRSFFEDDDLEVLLEDLVSKNYLKKEYPKRKLNGKRVQDETLPIGYNIVAGKISYEISQILDPNDLTPTLVAMDMNRLYVVDGNGLRTLSLREGLRLFGYPENYKFDISPKDGYDLLGNTIVVPVIKEVSKRLLQQLY